MVTPDRRQQRRRDLIALAEQVAQAPLPTAGPPMPLIAGLVIVGTVSIGAGVTMVSSDSGSSSGSATTTTLFSAPSATAPGTTAPAVMALPPTPTSIPPGTRIPVPGEPVRWVVFAEGRFHLRGTVPDLASGQAIAAQVGGLLGDGRVVVEYVVDPTGPVAVDNPVYVPDAAVFAAGSAELDAAAQSELRLVWGLLGSSADATVEIHSNPTSPDLMVDAARVDSVRRWFVDSGVDASRITVTDLPLYGPALVADTTNAVGISVHGVFG